MRHDITPADIRAVIKRPSDFGYHGDLPIGETWALGPVIVQRDSGPLDQVNDKAIRAMFAEAFGPEGEENGWEVTRCGHWAVGWVEHLSFRAVDDDGQATPQFQLWRDIEDRMDSYPVLDEDALAEAEYDALIEHLEWSASRYVRSDAPDDWAARLAGEVRDCVRYESDGPYVREVDIIEGLRELYMLDTSDDDDDTSDDTDADTDTE